jgi:hypothetical protein
MRMVGTRGIAGVWRIRMPKYLLSWEDTIWYNLEIEADSEEGAHEKFHSGDYDYEDIEEVGIEMVSGSLSIEQV